MFFLIFSEEQLTSIAERTILEADQNGDQMISFEEFCSALERTDVEQKMSIRFLNWNVDKSLNWCAIIIKVISFWKLYEDTIRAFSRVEGCWIFQML